MRPWCLALMLTAVVLALPVDKQGDCVDLFPNQMYQGFLTCDDFSDPANAYLCDVYQDASLSCCSCGGGGPGGGSTGSIVPVTAENLESFTAGMDDVLYSVGGCRSPSLNCQVYYEPMLTAMHAYNVQLTRERAVAFVATILHETDRFRTFYQPLDGGAGAIHMTPPNQVVACNSIPSLRLAMSALVPGCQDPCTCDPNTLGATVQSTDYAFLTAAWFVASGSQQILGPTHGCVDLLSQADDGVGGVNAACTALLAYPSYPTNCNLRGFYFVSYCVFGNLQSASGMQQRVEYYHAAWSTFGDGGQAGAFDSSGGGSGGSGGSGAGEEAPASDPKTAMIAIGCVMGALFLLVVYCCVFRSPKENLRPRGETAPDPEDPGPPRTQATRRIRMALSSLDPSRSWRRKHQGPAQGPRKQALGKERDEEEERRDKARRRRTDQRAVELRAKHARARPDSGGGGGGGKHQERREKGGDNRAARVDRDRNKDKTRGKDGEERDKRNRDDRRDDRRDNRKDDRRDDRDRSAGRNKDDAGRDRGRSTKREEHDRHGKNDKARERTRVARPSPPPPVLRPAHEAARHDGRAEGTKRAALEEKGVDSPPAPKFHRGEPEKHHDGRRDRDATARTARQRGKEGKKKGVPEPPQVRYRQGVYKAMRASVAAKWGRAGSWRHKRGAEAGEAQGGEPDTAHEPSEASSRHSSSQNQEGRASKSSAGSGSSSDQQSSAGPGGGPTPLRPEPDAL